MSFVALKVILNLRAKAGEVESLKAWFGANLAESKDQDGCISVEALEHEEDPSKVVIIGTWETRGQWEAYIRWRERRGDFAVLAPMLEGEPHFECLQVLGEWKAAI